VIFFSIFPLLIFVSLNLITKLHFITFEISYKFLIDCKNYEIFLAGISVDLTEICIKTGEEQAINSECSIGGALMATWWQYA
jgi:hypothetical protein